MVLTLKNASQCPCFHLDHFCLLLLINSRPSIYCYKTIDSWWKGFQSSIHGPTLPTAAWAHWGILWPKDGCDALERSYEAASYLLAFTWWSPCTWAPYSLAARFWKTVSCMRTSGGLVFSAFETTWHCFLVALWYKRRLWNSHVQGRELRLLLSLVDMARCIDETCYSIVLQKTRPQCC